ncbi:type II secretion system protein [Candidatus Falkowbacteria bacterium]|nr:type II secretion system protein [Candidatus Falkowbacteria bacterium]
MKFKSTNKEGFTLIELTVIIFIISLAMVGVLSLVIQNIQVEYINKNTLIASQLAQEGLELVRNKRDANWLAAGNNWKTGTSTDPNTNIAQDGNYAIDYSGAIDGAVNSIEENGAKLKIDDNGFYWHGTGEASNFSRLISVVDYGNYLAASSTARWRERGNYYNYAAETILYDWK